MKDPDIIAQSYKNFIFKFARATIGSAKQVLWEASASVYNCFDETSDELFSVISTSANDKVGGGGATHFKFIYQMLDGSELESTEIELNGLVAVDIPDITGVISYRMWITQTEDQDILTGPNHGIIKLYQTGTASKIYAEIPIAEGQTLMGIYRIPVNKYAELKSVFLDGSEGKTAIIWIKVRKDRSSAWLTKATRSVFQSANDHETTDPVFIYPGSDVVILAQGSAAGTIVNAHFELELKSLED